MFALPDPTGTELQYWPGQLILVVGPSGAGKDTLIDHAKNMLAGQNFSFPSRVVTRPSSSAEAHDSCTPDEFSDATRRGAFAVTWRAHGLDYAIPIAIEGALRRGTTVVCNVSRAVVAELRNRYPRVRVVFVDAPLAVRIARIQKRGGRSDSPDRARRAGDFDPSQADVVIDNGAALELSARAFLNALRAVPPRSRSAAT